MRNLGEGRSLNAELVQDTKMPLAVGVGSAALAVGFGITVAMWFVGYVGRLPALMLPSPLLLSAMLVCLVGGGLLLGRHAGGPGLGAAAGCVSGLLNLLVLGSFLGGDAPGRVAPSAWWWVPGSVLVSAVLAGVGAGIGTRWLRSARPFQDWTAAFVRVAVAATLLLLAVGGLVTSAEAGLAVDDWPTSFGYNMFLYPFSRMTGGIYYEHAHRLFGALVGLTTLALALFLHRKEERGWVRRLGWLAVGLVVVQGLLGGIRVTGRSVPLAMIHGILAQLFFATLVALAAFTSPTWKGGAAPLRRESVRVDRALAGTLVAITVCQLVLGAAQRHFHALLIVHVLAGLGVVSPLAFHHGLRTWGLNAGQPLLKRLGLILVALVGVQLVLGFGAYIDKELTPRGGAPSAFNLAVATAHQWVGAVILATAVLLLCWSYRLLAPPAPGASTL